MSMGLRKAMIRLFLPVWWKPSRRRIAEKMEHFSVIEADSAWQFLRGLDAVENPVDRAQMFNNALEEVHHAALFERAAGSYREQMGSRLTPEREQLYEAEKGLDWFLAYAYVGEQDVLSQFEAYAAAVGPGRARDTFEDAMGDEADHVVLARELLLKIFGSEKILRKHERKIRRQRAWQSWLRFSKALGELSSGLILSGIYIPAGLIYSRFSRRRLREAGRPLAEPARAGEGA